MNNRLRHFREDRLLTQDELGARCGVSGVCISQIETGSRAGRWRTRKLIARALDVPESVLFPDARCSESNTGSSLPDHLPMTATA
jgi:transcriptional regulator with XRE-family HTH domain